MFISLAQTFLWDPHSHIQFPPPDWHLWVCLADISNLTCLPQNPCFPMLDLSLGTSIFHLSKEPHSPPIISIRNLREPLLSYFSLNPPHFVPNSISSQMTLNPPISHLLHCYLSQIFHHSFDELLKQMHKHIHSCALESILHKWARVNVWKCHWIMCIVVHWFTMPSWSTPFSTCLLLHHLEQV